jgi:hypothetical protein
MVLSDIINRKNIYFFGLALLIASIPLSRYVMSMAQLLLTANWLFDPKIVEKFRAFFRNKAAVIVVSLFLLHIIGLLWTSDFDYAVKDLRTKVPILALPIIISTSPLLSRRSFHYFILLFIAANVAGSLFSIHALLTKEIVEIRLISLFISHIRFSLNICIAIFSGGYLIFIEKDYPVSVKILIFAAIIWLVIFLTIMEAVTGIVILVSISALLLILLVFYLKKPVFKISLILILILITASSLIYVEQLYREILPKEKLSAENLDKFSKRGNPYLHDTTLQVPENGHWVYLYVQNDELREVWSQRSSLDFDSLDKKGNPLRFTIYRYLTSKGLRKDAEGLELLSQDEIHAIENSVANVDDLAKSSLSKRIKAILWEVQVYRSSGFISGHSVTQRLEFWKAGEQIIRKNFLLGTGTGDIVQAFDSEYREMNSTLKPQFRWRSHNQYISMLATFGIFGLLWFLAVLFVPGFLSGMNKDYFYFIFLCVLLLSMLTEDTLEDQAGVTFYAFFTSFFLFAREAPEIFFNDNTILKGKNLQ